MGRPDVLLSRLFAFVEALRSSGVRVSQQESLDMARALALLGEEAFVDRERLRATLAATLVKSGSEQPVFERVFDLHFRFEIEADPLLAEDLTGSLERRGLSPERAAELAAAMGAEAPPDSELLRALLAGDVHELTRLLRLALEQTDLRGLETPFQIGYFAQRLLTRLGMDDLEARLANLVAAAGGSASEDEARALRGSLDERLLALRRLGRRAIQAEYEKRRAVAAPTDDKEALLDRPFAQLSRAEHERMKVLVRRLAERLKARLLRLERQRKRGRLDVRRTLRASLATAGVPLRLHFKKKRRERPEIVVLCDVSDSVRAASVFMLELVYSLSELFREVRGFVFVDRIGEVTELFERVGPDEAIEAVQRGDVVSVYANSDYGRVLRDFFAAHEGSLGRKTTVVLLGDGRTNYRASESWVLEEIQRRVRHVIWLCPEPRGLWGFGDSEMPAYARHVDAALVVSNLRELAAVVDRLVL